MSVRPGGKRAHSWLVAVSVAAVALGARWVAQPGGSEPGEGTVVNRVVEGPLDQVSRTGPVTLWTPPTTQPPKAP